MDNTVNDQRSEDDENRAAHGVAFSKRRSQEQTATTTRELPRIIPPPTGVHSKCDICDENYYTTEIQQSAMQRLPETDICAVYEGACTDEQAQQVMYSAIQRTTGVIGQIKAILTSHGDTIIKRWTKKSKEKRTIRWMSVRSSSMYDPGTCCLPASSLIVNRLSLIHI